jgi:hypothetical protein
MLNRFKIFNKSGDNRQSIFLVQISIYYKIIQLTTKIIITTNITKQIIQSQEKIKIVINYKIT